MMLRVVPLAPQSVIQGAYCLDEFRNFHPEEETWVVSDLKSKLDLQERLMEGRSFLPGDCVLRASDLWRILLSRLRPDMQVISRELMLTLIADYLAQQKIEWAHTSGASELLFEYITQLMPVLTHPLGDDILADWFEENPTCGLRWQNWYGLARQTWNELLEQRLVTTAWMGGVLTNESGFHGLWQRRLYFHLGSELSKVEADLIQLLSQVTDVTVFRPRPMWEREFERSLRAYDFLSAVAGSVAKPPVSSPSVSPAKASYRKFTTMLAEVKFVTAQTRRWLDDGIRPQDIALVAPDIESYWPVMARYLEEEGIPVRKDQVTTLQSLPNVGIWLSHLRLKVGIVSEADLEMGLFTSSLEPLIPYARFEVLYKMIYADADLQRDENVGRLFRADWSPDHRLNRDEFVLWALGFLPGQFETGHLDTVLQKLFQECPAAQVLSVQRWVRYLEFLVARSEFVLAVGQPDGVSVINLVSAEHTCASHVIVLGMTEKALRSSAKTALTLSDAESLSAAFGFHLLTVDPAKADFELRWLLDGPQREFELCVAETDFTGDVQAPSWIWIRGALEDGELPTVEVPAATRWDEIQRSDWESKADLRNWSSAEAQKRAQGVASDLGEKEFELVETLPLRRLSASGVEDFLNCPFMFAAKRFFALSEDPYLDMDIDGFYKGRFIHALLEKLTVEPFRQDWSEEELKVLLKEIRREQGGLLADERIWPGFERYCTRLGRNFVRFEAEWRAQYGGFQTVGREVEIHGGLSWNEGDFLTQSQLQAHPDLGVPIFGRIDRVDCGDDGRLAVLDYKLSDYELRNWKSWLNNNEIQLLFYAMALEKGLSKLPASEVAAACYYVVKTLDRETGFVCDDVELSPVSRGNSLSAENKQKLFDDFRQRMKEALRMMRSGAIPPRPFKEVDCEKCNWRDLCRAPHLN